MSAVLEHLDRAIATFDSDPPANDYHRGHLEALKVARAELATIEVATWRCFHCDETFHTKEAAAEHFGSGNYESELPLCIEAATSEQSALILTNREMWARLLKVEEELEQAEYERDCWSSGARMFLGQPNATWHDLATYRDPLEGRVLAAEAAIDAAPNWLAGFLRRLAERRWRRRRTVDLIKGGATA
jgi:hypothetical protein